MAGQHSLSLAGEPRAALPFGGKLPQDLYGPYNESMKAITVSELKAHLSKYLRMAQRGERIVVKDRDAPIAEIGRLQGTASGWRERLAQHGRLRPGTQRWDELKLAPLPREVDVQAALRDIREDPDEVPRR